MRLADTFHLTYCSNIHPGETWEEVFGNLKTYVPAVRERLSPHAPFGLGLRLSAEAAETLEQPGRLVTLQKFLTAEQCYVFTINGFPYGRFHGTRVKEDVYLPDWKDEARLVYTNRLARILAALLPDDPALEGSVSTAPGAFRARVRSADDVRRMAELMLRHAACLARLRQQTGRTITLAIEPEPCCYVETIDEAIAFFRDFLFNPALLQTLAGDLGVSPRQAEQIVRRHIGLCYDACHMAVEFEEIPAGLERIASAGIQICKFQISSAVRFQFRHGDGRAEKILGPFAESTYLHQVVERSDRGTVRYVDLPEALADQSTAALRASGPGQETEWRVHFHIPIFLDSMSDFGTTQDHLKKLIEWLKRHPVCPYLEVETYTWDVLPSQFKTLDTVGAIVRELAWVRDQIES
ncbi:MAG: metabolite traffic protein EboE [Acidobacteriota bacterium]